MGKRKKKRKARSLGSAREKRRICEGNRGTDRQEMGERKEREKKMGEREEEVNAVAMLRRPSIYFSINSLFSF